MKKLKQEKGIALVAVVSALIFIGVLTASIVVISKTTAYSIKTTRERSLSAYYAESSLARAQWLLISDQIKYPSRDLGKDDSENTRYLADGVVHNISSNDIESQFSIIDMNSGYDLSTNSQNLDYLLTKYDDDPENKEKFQAFLNKIKDYTDSNDLLNIDGFENKDYENKELYPLPRNAPFQYREEIMFIPGFSDFFSFDKYGRISSFSLIKGGYKPRGLNLSNSKHVATKLNFFAISKNHLTFLTEFNDDQIELILEARKKWIENQEDLSNSLDFDIINKLKSTFSFSESKEYTIIVNSPTNAESAKRTLFASFKILQDKIFFYEFIIY